MKKLIAILSSSLIIAALAMAADKAKFSPDLMKADPNATLDVIVQFRQELQQKYLDKVRQKGGHEKARHTFIRAATITMTAAAARELAADPDVGYVSPDRGLHGSLEYVQPAVNANIALSLGYNGNGIGIAIIDSGFLAKANDLKDSMGHSRVVYDQSFVWSGNALEPVGDQHGHGSHVAGIAAGNGSDSTCATCIRTFKGIAPSANLINLRVLDANGNGKDSWVIAAIERAIQLKTQYNVRIINLSLGRPAGGEESGVVRPAGADAEGFGNLPRAPDGVRVAGRFGDC